MLVSNVAMAVQVLVLRLLGSDTDICFLMHMSECIWFSQSYSEELVLEAAYKVKNKSHCDSYVKT